MNHIHNNTEKKVITLNDLHQPISHDAKAVSELSSFLGTTVRQFVSLTCVSWHEVPEKELLWEYVKVIRFYITFFLFSSILKVIVDAVYVIFCRTSMLSQRRLNRGF